MWRWVYLSLFQPCWKENHLLFLIPSITPPGAGRHCKYQCYGSHQWRCVPIDGFLPDASGSATQNLSFFMLKDLVSPNVLHGPVLRIRLLNPNCPYNGQTFCFLIPLRGFGQSGKIPVQKGLHFLPLSFSLPLLREGYQHQRHGLLLMDVPRLPCSQGNHLK